MQVRCPHCTKMVDAPARWQESGFSCPECAGEINSSNLSDRHLARPAQAADTQRGLCIISMSSQEYKYQPYEILRVKSADPEKVYLNGREVAVLGFVENDDGSCAYAVHVYGDDEEELWVFQEHELEPTGRHDTKESFFTGESLVVKVDEETGAGQIIEYKPPPGDKSDADDS